MDLIPKIDTSVADTATQKASTPVNTAGDVSIFGSCSEYEAKNQGYLVTKPDAKDKVQAKITRAIKLIKEYGPKYHQQGFGPDFSEELENLGERNIKLEPATGKNLRSMGDSKYFENKPKRAFSLGMGASETPSKISLHYNNKDVYNASDEEIAATIVHELGHVQTHSKYDSVAEEKKVETDARNFESYIKSPNNFKYNETPEGIEDFLNLYRNNPCQKYPEK